MNPTSAIPPLIQIISVYYTLYLKNNRFFNIKHLKKYLVLYIIMLVKTIDKNGNIKVYEYDDKKYDHKKYYNTYKNDTKGGRVVCDICNAKVLNLNIEKHKASKRCRTYNEPNI